MSDPVNIGILGATFETPNMGVSMLAAGAIRAALCQFPSAKITIFDYHNKQYIFQFRYDDDDININFINLRFSKKLYVKNNIAVLLALALVYRLAPTGRIAGWVLERNESLKCLAKVDLFSFVAYGDSFSDIYGLSRFIYIILPPLLSIVMQRRLVFLPQTIGPFKSKFVATVARAILQRADLIYCRDYEGVTLTERLLAPSRQHRVRFCYDMAFDVDPKAPESLEIRGLDEIHDHVLVGVNVSGLLLSGGYTGRNMFGLKTDYGDLVRAMVRFLIEAKGSRVLLVPHVLSPPGEVESDVGACSRLFEELSVKYPGMLGFAAGRYQYDEIKYVIGRCDVFVGARMHACIGALSQCIPTLLVAYSDKFSGIMKPMGLEELVADPRTMTIQEILKILDRIHEDRARLSDALRARMPDVRRTIRAMLRDVAAPIAAVEC